jgi:hypothetical protein
MERSISLRMLLVTASLSLFAANAHSQNLLTNGDFATFSLAPWVPFTTSNGTNGPNLPNVLKVNNQGGAPTYVAHFNVGEVDFDETQQGGGINQSFQVTTAGTYNVFATIGSQDDKDGEQNEDAGAFSILIDGVTVATKSLGAFGSAHQTIQSTLSGSVNLAAGSHTFEILITRDALAGQTATPNEAVTNLSVALATDVRTQ